jgi:hypothetical protein
MLLGFVKHVVNEMMSPAADMLRHMTNQIPHVVYMIVVGMSFVLRV